MVFRQVMIKINNVANSWNQLMEGMDVKITCHADSNPPEVHYSWYVNDTERVPERPTELIIKNISRHYHESIVKCEAYNLVGKSEDSETLHVICEFETFTFCSFFVPPVHFESKTAGVREKIIK